MRATGADFRRSPGRNCCRNLGREDPCVAGNLASLIQGRRLSCAQQGHISVGALGRIAAEILAEGTGVGAADDGRGRNCRRISSDEPKAGGARVSSTVERVCARPLTNLSWGGSLDQTDPPCERNWELLPALLAVCGRGTDVREKFGGVPCAAPFRPSPRRGGGGGDRRRGVF